ncbi:MULTISPECIES: helix-turn-helix domain-containing protein [Bradyrhizobium]|uniref:Helix-turn-helix domain-containing protein n=1 Tax=Bradyrhizobium elkanii TaxID=29448 RepID=A0A4V6CYZ9_BRAEL|nr:MULTISPECIES: helix-turn-helix domain-containing protein [Bradyrhizobium]MTV14596.1 helix-turn-helix domain-containing protein [Bradyrhizobium sp. BR2003]TKV82925.1 helix-turn-helix domain-containing protein [Bradyrhizobium elkanii]
MSDHKGHVVTGNHSATGRSVRSSAQGGASFSESDFLLQLGAAMRGARANLGMTRRELARRSGVSQRYIALIEAGKGNVSIVLLLRILRAFRHDPAESCEDREGSRLQG